MDSWNHCPWMEALPGKVWMRSTLYRSEYRFRQGLVTAGVGQDDVLQTKTKTEQGPLGTESKFTTE